MKNILKKSITLWGLANLLLSISGLGWGAPPSSNPPEASTTNNPTLYAVLQKTENYPIDLATVVQLVHCQNLVLQRDRVGQKISTTKLRQSQAAFLPDINLTYGQNRFQGGVQIFGGQTTDIFRTTIQPQIEALWTLYPGGRTVFEMLAAKQHLRATRLQVKETFQQQLSLAAQDYFRLLETSSEEANALKNLQNAQRQLSQAQARYDVGVGIKLDVMRAQSVVSQREQQLAQAQGNIGKAEQALLNRLNLEPNLHLRPTQVDLENPVLRLISENTPLSKLLQGALQENPAILRLQRDIASLKEEYRAIFSDFIPSVTLRTYLNGTGPHYQDLQLSRFGGIFAELNLLDQLGFRVPLRLQEQRQIIEQRALELQQLRRDIETQVTEAVLNIWTFHSSIVASQQEVTAAEEAYQLAAGRYEAGIGTSVDVLDSEAALAQAKQRLALAIFQLNQAQVQLLEATGQISPETLIPEPSSTASRP